MGGNRQQCRKLSLLTFHSYLIDPSAQFFVIFSKGPDLTRLLTADEVT